MLVQGTPEVLPWHQGQVGFMLAHEQFTVPQLVELGVADEQAGFDFVATSDHLQPWQANEGHAGCAWITLSALGQRTRHIWMGTTVTCPSLRYNPAVVAQAFASMDLLYPGRVFLGLGSGEALNEEVAMGHGPSGQSVLSVWWKRQTSSDSFGQVGQSSIRAPTTRSTRASMIRPGMLCRSSWRRTVHRPCTALASTAMD
jgi:hypothetical protein